MRSMKPLTYLAVITVLKAAISPIGMFSIRLPPPLVLPWLVWETVVSVAPSNWPSLG